MPAGLVGAGERPDVAGTIGLRCFFDIERDFPGTPVCRAALPSQFSTKRRLRQISSKPSLREREPWDVWEAAGSKTATDRIRANLKKIPARHMPSPLPDGAAEKIEAILQEAKTRSG